MKIAFREEVRTSFSRVKTDVSGLRRALNRERLATGRFAGKVQTLVTKEEFYSLVRRISDRLDKIDTSIEKLSHLKRRMATLQEDFDVISSIKKGPIDTKKVTDEIEKVRKGSADKAFVLKKEKDLKSQINALKAFLESAISEVDIGEYVTKKDLEKRLLKVQDLGEYKVLIKEEIASMRQSVEIRPQNPAHSERFESLRAEVGELSEELKYVKESVGLAVGAEQKKPETQNASGVLPERRSVSEVLRKEGNGNGATNRKKSKKFDVSEFLKEEGNG